MDLDRVVQSTCFPESGTQVDGETSSAYLWKNLVYPRSLLSEINSFFVNRVDWKI